MRPQLSRCGPAGSSKCEALKLLGLGNNSHRPRFPPWKYIPASQSHFALFPEIPEALSQNFPVLDDAANTVASRRCEVLGLVSLRSPLMSCMVHAAGQACLPSAWRSSAGRPCCTCLRSGRVATSLVRGPSRQHLRATRLLTLRTGTGARHAGGYPGGALAACTPTCVCWGRLLSGVLL